MWTSSAPRLFPEKKLRKVIKTRRYWMFSWLTGSGVYKEDQLEDDKDRLQEFYRRRATLTLKSRTCNSSIPRRKSMVIKIHHLRRQRSTRSVRLLLRVPTVLPTNAVNSTFNSGPEPKSGPARGIWQAGQKLHRAFVMKVGDTFTPEGLSTNVVALQNFYGSHGYIDVAQGGHIRTKRIANTETGTMDLDYVVDEGQKILYRKD